MIVRMLKSLFLGDVRTVINLLTVDILTNSLINYYKLIYTVSLISEHLFELINII